MKQTDKPSQTQAEEEYIPMPMLTREELSNRRELTPEEKQRWKERLQQYQTDLEVRKKMREASDETQQQIPEEPLFTPSVYLTREQLEGLGTPKKRTPEEEAERDSKLRGLQAQQEAIRKKIREK